MMAEHDEGQVDMVMLRWQQGHLVQLRMVNATMPADSIDVAVEALAYDRVAWVRAEDVQAVLARVLGAQ